MVSAKLAFTVLVALFSLGSCCLWVKSATVEVFHDESADSWSGVLLTKSTKKGTVDILKTAEEQTKWNKLAAGCAAAAAICQVVLMWVTY